MIPLSSTTFPHDTATLRTALAQALEPLGLGPDALTLEGEMPHLAALRVDLGGARFHRSLPFTSAAQPGELAFIAREVAMHATPAHFEALSFTLQARAQDAVFTTAKDRQGSPVLAFSRCGVGTLTLSATRAELESALLALAREAAQKQGAEVESVKVQLTAESPHALRLHATATAKAMFFTATLTIVGKIEIIAPLALQFSGLSCTGDGMIANLAASFLRPRLAALEGRGIPLQSLLPSLHDLTLDAADGLRIHAKFGSQ